MSSYPCPNCKEPIHVGDGKCWHCGWNTAGYEEQVHPHFGRPLSELMDYSAKETKKYLTGLSSSYYQLPEGCKELQDLIEYKNMNFARGNVFKAAYRLGDKPGTDQIYDWEKIIWFANREIERLKKNA